MDQSSEDNEKWTDPVIAEYMKGVDVTLLHQNLKLTPQQRFEKMEQVIRDVDQIRGAARRQSQEKDGPGNQKAA